jgi:hypothetical protein
MQASPLGFVGKNPQIHEIFYESLALLGTQIVGTTLCGVESVKAKNGFRDATAVYGGDLARTEEVSLSGGSGGGAVVAACGRQEDCRSD